MSDPNHQGSKYMKNAYLQYVKNTYFGLFGAPAEGNGIPLRNIMAPSLLQALIFREEV